MKIYHDGVEWTRIPATRKRHGSFADRLVGINISQNKERILVEPIYQALLKFERQGDFTFITLSWDQSALVIVLMPTWPFLNFIRPEGYQLEAE